MAKLIALLVAVPVAAVLCHTPWSTGYTRLEPEALGFVVEQFAARDVVIVGESHRVAQDDLTDTTSYYALHRPGLRLADFADGYVILAGLDQRRAVRPFDDLGDDAQLAFLRERFRSTGYEPHCTAAEDLRRFVERNGLLPEHAFDLVDRAWRPSVNALWPVAGGRHNVLRRHSSATSAWRSNPSSDSIPRCRSTLSQRFRSATPSVGCGLFSEHASAKRRAVDPMTLGATVEAKRSTGSSNIQTPLVVRDRGWSTQSGTVECRGPD